MMKLFSLACSSLVIISGLIGPVRVMAQQVQDLVTPLSAASPRLRFHLGQVANNQPVISPILPNIPGAASPYLISQWGQSSYVQPDLLQVQDSATYDARLGKATYAFEAPDGHAHVRLFPYNGTWAYELYQAGGTLIPGGGTNLFLTSDAFIPNATFDRTLDFDFDLKLARAAVYASSQAQTSGAVIASVFTGFGLMFTDPLSGKQQFVFMQVPVTDSRKWIDNHKGMNFCSGTVMALFSPNLVNNEPILPFAPELGPFHHFHYGLNAYLAAMVSANACGGGWPASAADLKNWRLTGFYMGLESESSDHRVSVTALPQGNVEVGIQVANIRATGH